jgi:hypothetical protein
MALPIKLSDTVGFEVDSTFIITLLLTVISGWLVSLFFSTNEEPIQHKTPKKPKRKAHNIPPGAPISKRVRPCMPKVSSDVARELFPIDNLIDPIEDTLPAAPKELPTEPTIISSTSAVALPEIKDLRTVAYNKALSTETSDLSSRVYTKYQILGNKLAIDGLWLEGAKYDLTAPHATVSKPSLTHNDVNNYLLSLLNILNAMRLLNVNKYALPHQGTGEYTQWTDGSDYKLIDMLNNSISGIIQYNKGLAVALNAERQKYTPIWTTTPQSFVDCCRMSRDAHVLAGLIMNQHSTNANLTSWADW